MNYSEHIKSRKSDDEFTAEYKQHYRACTASVIILVIVSIFVWFTRFQFEKLANSRTLGVIFESAGSIIENSLSAILGISALYVLYTFVSFFLFYKKYSQKN